ncbi:MAG: hypothetical protein Q7R65_01260 [bacterium]|nr:hypothetical protein [bacterium]
MSWNVDFSSQALKFLAKNHLTEDEILEKIRLALRKFNGEPISVDIKKLGGRWAGFHRIRSGKIRLIVEFKFESQSAFIEVVDWRGNAYK